MEAAVVAGKCVTISSDCLEPRVRALNWEWGVDMARFFLPLPNPPSLRTGKIENFLEAIVADCDF